MGPERSSTLVSWAEESTLLLWTRRVWGGGPLMPQGPGAAQGVQRQLQHIAPYIWARPQASLDEHFGSLAVNYKESLHLSRMPQT